jgi:anti-sigma B factor antagonist
LVSAVTIPVPYRKEASSFDCVAWETDHGDVWMRLSGELDIATVSRVDGALSDALANADSVVVDLRQLAFIDGAGLGALVSARARALTEGRRLSLVRGPRQFDALLGATGLADLFETAEGRGSDLEPASAADAQLRLQCPRCRLTIELDVGSRAEHEHCPRCLGASRLAIPMFRVA